MRRQQLFPHRGISLEKKQSSMHFMQEQRSKGCSRIKKVTDIMSITMIMITTMRSTAAADIMNIIMITKITTMRSTAAVDIMSITMITIMTMRSTAAVDIMSITTITTMSVDVAADMTTITIITIMQMMCLQAGARRLLTSIQKKSWI